jgi:ATP-dependent DNA ligase
MASTIQLAKGYDPSKLVFPVMMSEKLDGVPTLMNFATQHDGGTGWACRSRQNKPQTSIHDQVQTLAWALGQAWPGRIDASIVAEVTHIDKRMPFKDVSGHVRRDKQNDDLVLNIFDAVIHDYNADRGFGGRIAAIENVIRSMGKSPGWRVIPQIMLDTQEELDVALAAMVAGSLDFTPEGAVVRSCDELWQPGKRTWGYQKYVLRPTTEVEVIGFECAKSKDGEYLDMVGRIIAKYRGEIIGVGPGKLDHSERHRLWIDYTENDNELGPDDWTATVSYKRDPSYKALREPTFQHWRPE